MMKIPTFLIALFFLSFNFNLLAHKGGHGAHNAEHWTIDGKSIEASFLTFKDGHIFLETTTGKILVQDLASFSEENQQLLTQRIDQINKINQISNNTIIVPPNEPSDQIEIPKKVFLYTILVVAILIFSYFIRRKKTILASTAFLSLLAVLIVACKESDDSDNPDDTSEVDDTVSTPVPANDIALLETYFGHFSNVTTSSDDTYFYVSSTGIPEHDMMEGITNWQQQVPIPQDYTGTNSWAFPLQPELAETPLASSEHFLRGAIAIAINGIPIFNPLNNRGEDALSIGELDDWGGHCGRADDYHYHVPPTHLETSVGSDQPIAYALDGFPIYGETSEELDEYLGKFNEDGSYQYHTTDTAPYFIAGMRGEVTLDPSTTAPEDQILPQAITREVRPALTPLAGAVITNFSAPTSNAYSLEYQIGTDTYYTNYSWDENGLYTYEYIDADGSVTTETYQR